jgi:mannan endo-1,4-beta-mannosidase
MRAALRAALAAVIVMAAAGCGFMHPPAGPADLAGDRAVASIPARPLQYFGAYVEGAPASYRAITRFGRTVGRQPNLAPYYSAWLAPFQAGFAATAHAHGAVPLTQINPVNVPVAAIARGRYDPYLRSYAAQVRDYRHPVIIGFGHEMNGPWFTWGWTHVPAKTFVAAWRHIVTVFRKAGAYNVTWLWTVNRNGNNTGPFRKYWPGASYVTWVGIDGYYEVSFDDFANIFGPTIRDIRKFTKKPVLVSETAAGVPAGQAAKIPDLFAGLRTWKALGFIWFDELQKNGIHHQDWHLDDDQASISEFRAGLREFRGAGP